jgi:hypothetical protein
MSTSTPIRKQSAEDELLENFGELIDSAVEKHAAQAVYENCGKG